MLHTVSYEIHVSLFVQATQSLCQEKNTSLFR